MLTDSVTSIVTFEILQISSLSSVLSHGSLRSRLSLSGRGRRLERSRGLRELLLRSSEVGIRLRGASQVLVRVEASDGGNISDVGQLQEVAGLILVVVSVVIVGALTRIIVAIVLVSLVLVTSISSVIFALRVAHLLGHGRQSDTLGKVGKRIDEASLLFLVVVERAALAELARARFLPILAGNGLVVGVDGSKSGFAEILGQWLNTRKMALVS